MHRRHQTARALHHGQRQRVGEFPPIAPEMETFEIIASHQPDKPDLRKSLSQRLYGIQGVTRTQLPLDIADDQARIAGDVFRRGKALGEIAHGRSAFQRIAGADQPPDIIQLQPAQRRETDIEMAAMGGIEGAAEQPDLEAVCYRPRRPDPMRKRQGRT